MLIDFEEIKYRLNSSKWYGTQAWYDMLDIIGDCEDKSRPKGRWSLIKYEQKGNTEVWRYMCSRCEFAFGRYGWRFCPYCGADMGVEE